MSDPAAPTNAASAKQWWVQVRGKAFGPYSSEQMARFLSEGRVKLTTLASERADGGWTEVVRIPALRGMRTPSFANSNEAPAEAANVFVHAELVSGAGRAFMAALEGLGFVCELSSSLWLLRTRHSAGSIRNTLSQTLERGDRFVVMDATRDRLAWFNLGPEVDVRIARVWNGPAPASTERSAL